MLVNIIRIGIEYSFTSFCVFGILMYLCGSFGGYDYLYSVGPTPRGRKLFKNSHIARQIGSLIHTGGNVVDEKGFIVATIKDGKITITDEQYFGLTDDFYEYEKRRREREKIYPSLLLDLCCISLVCFILFIIAGLIFVKFGILK